MKDNTHTIPHFTFFKLLKIKQAGWDKKKNYFFITKINQLFTHNYPIYLQNAFKRLWYLFCNFLHHHHILWDAHWGVLTMEILQIIFSGNFFTYTILVEVFIYLHRYQANPQNNLERSILTLNNELQRMCIENEWRNEVISQDTVCLHLLNVLFLYFMNACILIVLFF